MAELIVTAINIFILFFAIGYFLSDMLTNMLAKRKDKIAESIETAKIDKEKAAHLRIEYEDKIKNFAGEKKNILENAKTKAKLREDEILKEAEAEAWRIIARANKEAELKKIKFTDDIKRDIVIYAHATAKQLIAENIDADKQALLIENTLSEMGEATWQG